ncbi:methyl-accepting chemotaxis protein [Psychrobium sp. MM17-31]|uniref:methyl-accepting chemotaxis protein n=1 Tax=Psychrobium sp. MM17-31 TaxID=2917758 RepID=UPI001EF47AB7|nr:methyl-accepting chemotaxis protein [Psychrobium sp. MM17-31]MCG7531542.1 methyl-accepting chemotaxis protein [Psychrobium sp. MM17-31]
MSKEQKFSKSDILLSTTDLDSRIKYANQHFCDIAGYSLDEMVGNPHNMVRHDDMPKAAFKDLWSFIQAGKSWMGPVKNSCKNGDYYWVNAFVTPIKDENGKIHEYQSVRTCPDDDVVNRANAIYPRLKSGNIPRQATAQTDQTKWVLAALLLTTVASLANLVLSGINVGSVLMTLLAVGTSALFYSWRQKYVKVVGMAKDIFDNPLMTYLYSGNNDDIGVIELAFKKRQAEIAAIVGRVSDISGSINQTAQQSSERGSNVSQILSEQRHETEQVAAASNEMSATVQEITQTVSQAAQASHEGLKISSEGQEQVNRTGQAINQLSNQLSEVNNAIDNLTSGCRSIESVSNEISSIAEQTNLLALNAAIEAARAGEQGRGFAVVADEVRALAQRTQQSTKEIDDLLAQLMQESDNATQAMNEGNRLSDACVELSKQTGESLAKVHHEVSDIAAISQQISEAIGQQAVVAEEVNQNVIAISDMSTQSEEHGREATELSLNLLEKLREQQGLILQFKG